MFFIHSLLLSQLLITTHLQNIETATESLFFINNLLDHFQNRNDLLFSVPLLSNYEWSTITSIVLDSIESAIEYLWAHRNKVNLDGYLGPRMLEGIIDTMLKLYQQKTPEDIAERMETILRKSQELTNFGLLNVKKQTPFYFSRVGFLLGPQLWNRYYPARLLSNFSTRYSPVKEDSWTEYESDNCLREFLDKTDENYCNISYKCWKLATSENQTEYSLTHQVFYFMIGLQSDCGETMNYILKLYQPGSNIVTYLQQLCTNIALEAQRIANSNFPNDFRDLFMEQVGFCGLTGFWQICKFDWLDKIINWQSISGCYHKFYTEEMNPKNFDPNEYGHYKRRKRSEGLLSSGRLACLSHRTSVALIALGSYLRYLIEFH